ncbi:ABC transporter substrate-binding protein [Pseudofrankia sp. BMG5.36]|uniref:ABC transporter substrate-binding protein n=1 Tax=Pseudofrankia sp. BMG5.36 TaxID=1834512 RepID=UPI0009F70EAB|nr:ABC transporter substrate-binding protein [Pseudofrankia sp. BMG5.36]
MSITVRGRHGRPTRRGVAVAIALVTSLVVAACGGGGGGGGSTSATGGNVLVIGMTASNIPLLDTGMAQSEGGEGQRFVGFQLYDALTKYDLRQGTSAPKLVPGLAESWEPNADLSSWTFKLRPGVTFHDGTAWNADAAVFNIERYAIKESPNFYQPLNAQAGLSVSGIKAVSKVDDMTIRIDTKGPWSYFPYDAALIVMGSPTAIKKLGPEGFAQHPVGTGPFKFVSVTRGQRLELAANENYWGGRPKLDKLILRPIPDTTARVAALRSGEVNWIEVPPPDDVSSLKSEGFQILTNSYDHIWPWVFNVTKKPWNDVRVRQAANYAINRESLSKDILADTGEPANQVVPRANPAYKAADDYYSYDPAKAKQLLAEAGYPNGFTTTLSFPTSGSGNMVPIPMNTALQADLAKVGIKVELKPVEWGSMLTDFFAGNIPGGADALNISLAFFQEGFWYSWFGTGSTLNVGGYSNPRLDELLNQAKTTGDIDQRAGLYGEIGKILTTDAPWLYVVNDRNPRALAADVKGFVMPKSWYIDLTTVSVGTS